MADLISRAAAIDAIVSATAFPDAEYIKNLCQNPANSEDWLGGVCDAINAVEDVNTVDAVPVVHARWTEKETSENTIDEWQSAKCTNCGKYHTTPYLYYFIDYKFCPNCGAKMDGDA